MNLEQLRTRIGDPPPRGFPTLEFEKRVTRAQQLMHEQKLDALVVTAPPNFRYFSGLETQFWESPTRPWFILVPRTGAPIAVVPEISAPEVQRTWIKDVRSWPAPRPKDDGLSLLASVIASTERTWGRVGWELGREMTLRMPVIDFLALQDSCRGVEFVDGSPTLWKARQVKSQLEIDHLRYICRLASVAYEALAERTWSGQSEMEIAREARVLLHELGADSVPFLPVISGRDGVSQIVCGPGKRTVADGDLIFIDTGATFDGYFCDFDRIYSVGRLSSEAKKAHEALWQATEAALRALRPGQTAHDLWAIMSPILEAAGARGNNVGRLGHGLGLQLTEPPSNMPGDFTVLQSGMVMTIEPGMEFAPGKMIVHEENVVITEEGCELLTLRAPREIWNVA